MAHDEDEEQLQDGERDQFADDEPGEGGLDGAGASGSRHVARGAPPGGDFGLFLHKLRIQTFLALGLLQNPVTGEKRCQLDHAEALLDDLAMLREKTAGNLTPQEERLFAAILEELQTQLLQQRQRDSGGSSSSARR
jgi:hypothetical protein